MYDNLQNDVEEIVRIARKPQVTPNSVVGEQVVDLIRRNYFWLEASVIVYDDVYGYERHTQACSQHKLHAYDRNWCVMLRDKPAYRNPFTPKMELISAEENYFPSIVSESAFDDIHYALWHETSANAVYDAISIRLEQQLGIRQNLGSRQIGK